MLVRGARPKFDALDVAKQLFNWALNRKHEFHSTCGNGYYDYRRLDYEFRKRKIDWEFDNLTKKNYDLSQLVKLNNDFYKPHPNVLNRSKEEIENFNTEHQISSFGNLKVQCPPPIFKFEELDLPEKTMEVINKLGYTAPNPVQSVTWPIALSGYNMVGIAQTGSGKTLGFVLPGLIHIKNQPAVKDLDGPVALVISPTRELAQQTERVLQPFADSFNFNTACVFGGASKNLQFRRLRVAEFCIGTPGRLLDFLKETTLGLSRCTYFVLDEADRLLEMGFEPQIKAIMGQMRADSQVLMWSATWPKEVKVLASEYLKDYIGVKFGTSELQVNPNVVQRVIVCKRTEKVDLLLNLLEEMQRDSDNKTLIFCETKKGVAFLQNLLCSKGYDVAVIHGDLSQLARDRALSAFRLGRKKFLLGTAVVGRGLDVTDIKHVINFDFPSTLEDYVHVVGRTGRKDKGTSHTFFTWDDIRFAKDLVKLLRDSNQEVSEPLLDLAENGIISTIERCIPEGTGVNSHLDRTSGTVIEYYEKVFLRCHRRNSLKGFETKEILCVSQKPATVLEL